MTSGVPSRHPRQGGSGASPGRGLRWILSASLATLGIGAGAASGSATLADGPGESAADAPPSAAADAHGADRGSRRLQACSALAQIPTPASPGERRRLLQRLDEARDSCKDHAGLLASLGGLWLEEGEPGQALIWLERSLLLDPGNRGAQLDLALALAALGDPTARDQLSAEWQGQPDVPPVAWARLAASRGTLPAATAAPARGRWARAGEASLVFGWESNLDHSPRLNELTITPPDGPIELELDQPLRPRPGAITVGEFSWQLAYSPQPETLIVAGAQATVRHAPEDRATDWNNVQVAASLSQRVGAWRGQLQLSASRFGGPLNEPFETQRSTISLNRVGLGCGHKVSAEYEAKTLPRTRTNDGRTTSIAWNTNCPLSAQADAVIGIALRAARDEPRDDNRPGGVQMLTGGGLRYTGPLSGPWRIDTSLRWQKTVTDQVYNQLLKADARREIRHWQFSAEFARSLSHQNNGGEWVVQLQFAEQTSNISIFTYRSTSITGGLRWHW